ncbi:MAG: DUF1080 domain-containing protein [Planctomycetota bacterium]
MKTKSLVVTASVTASLLLASVVVAAPKKKPTPAPPDATHPWAVHDPNRPAPKVVDPGPELKAPAPIPSDAIVLFDGTDPKADLSAFESLGVPWPIHDGYFSVPKGGKWLRTKEKFGDIQLHVEWRVPDRKGKIKGNSGIKIMEKYEVQVFEGEVYADGDAGAIYGQNPPLVDPSRGTDAWQTFDVVFRAPRFDENGELTRAGTMTVFFNGVLVQDNWALEGTTKWMVRPYYESHPEKVSIGIQDHSDPVQYRSIWVRHLEERPVSPAEVKLPKVRKKAK